MIKNLVDNIKNIDKKIFISEVLKTDSSNRTIPLLPEIEELLLQRKEEIEKNKYLYGKNNIYIIILQE